MVVVSYYSVILAIVAAIFCLGVIALVLLLRRLLRK